jgi:hypothetical protein
MRYAVSIFLKIILIKLYLKPTLLGIPFKTVLLLLYMLYLFDINMF